jgi:hypothetical protein
MAGAAFYQTDELERLAINLFYGWGYNFYRQENQLRADDLLVRQKISGLLGDARSQLEAAQSAWRREHIPPPSRAHPLPDPAAVAAARQLEALSAAVGQMEATIRSLPVPEADRMIQLYRDEAPTLQALGACDRGMVGLAEALRATLAGHDAAWVLENRSQIQEALDLLAQRVQERRDLLTIG